MRNKHVDLLALTPETDVEVLVNQVVRSEPLISDSRKPQLRKLVYKLIEKIDTSDTTQNFYLFKCRGKPIIIVVVCSTTHFGWMFCSKC